ncbi:MAG: hypothetical protein MMC23_004492 [Stictis urceolatum]|nr:hypothetical protein [Stictis urceolata]
MSRTTTQTSHSFSATASVPSGPTSSTLHFYQPPADGSAPFNFVEKQPEGVAQNNYGVQDQEVQITDMRGNESSFHLDKHAFLPLLVNETTRASIADFSSDEKVKETYYPEVEKLLLDNLPGSNRVFIFDHTIRRANPGADREPVLRTHIDQTTASAVERVRVHMGDEAEDLLQKRFRLVNVWRPLNGPVESYPLAVADSQTVKDDNLVPIEHRYPHRTGYTAGVKHDPDQKWYYLSGMTNDERLFLQCFDSQTPTRVPHTAFKDPRNTAESKPRESIEVRALIFG